MANETPESRENLRWEYREVAANHRFYVGLRFIIAALTATLQSALLTFYGQTKEAIRKIQERGEPLPDWFGIQPEIHPISIAFVGIATMLAIFFMERRNVNRLRIMIARGMELEFKLGLGQGQYGRLDEKEGITVFTYTWSLNILYSIICGLCALLFTFNLFKP